MDKKVLILCTGNSCRSIMAEALINAKQEGIQALSAGVSAKKQVHPLAKTLLLEKGVWSDAYYSKNLYELEEIDFDLVVTVCDNAKETCPMFPKPTKTIHVGFEDPDGKDYDVFEKVYNQIESSLLPKIQEELI